MADPTSRQIALKAVDVGIASLADIQPHTVDGRRLSLRSRIEHIIALGALADSLGLDHFGVGEHHSADFAVSSPAVLLAAVAQATSRVRLTSSVTNLSALDPVRVYEDFATLDLISDGRAEITAGRSAYPEPFGLFGADMSRYEELFAEKLDLLLLIRQTSTVTWRGRFRPALDQATIAPRAMQQPLPVWVGVGGTPTSAERAGRLGLPMILGYIGGPPERLRTLADIYREGGRSAGTAANLKLGVALHLFAAETMDEAGATYPHYADFLRPKRPGGGGFVVDRQAFTAGMAPGGHLMVGTSEHIAAKLIELYDEVAFDRVQALVDWGGLAPALVNASVERFATEIAPHLREHVEMAGVPA